MNQIVLGDVTVTRVMEYYGSVEMSPQTFFPESEPAAWQRNQHWLVPDFLDPHADVCVSAIQSWVLRSKGATIVVDTGVGNHKERPNTPVWHRLQTDYLDNLDAAGVRPEDVDYVVNTHVHVDHVGWNTYLDNGHWVPTFPNATYLIPRADFEFWDPENRPSSSVDHRNLFMDSIAPIHAAGRALLWEDGFDIDADLRLQSAPGHTPGSSVVTLESGNDRAVFVGDILHTALQFVEPDTNSCFCEDPAQARATRRRVLGWAADTNTLVVPAHLGGHGAAEIARDGNRFAIKAWAPFERLAHHA